MAPPSGARRLSLLGQAGAGKTTLSRALGQRLALPVVELDALFWEPNWQQAAPALFRARVAAALARPGWIADGNYSAIQDLTVQQADTVVWLDYGLPLLLARLLRRTVRRIVRREPLWGHNRERLRDQFNPQHSLFWYVVTSHARKRRRYAAMMGAGQPTGSRWLRFVAPREAEQWLAALPAQAPGGG